MNYKLFKNHEYGNFRMEIYKELIRNSNLLDGSSLETVKENIGNFEEKSAEKKSTLKNIIQKRRKIQKIACKTHEQEKA